MKIILYRHRPRRGLPGLSISVNTHRFCPENLPENITQLFRIEAQSLPKDNVAPILHQLPIERHGKNSTGRITQLVEN